jgi:hypothetical protein
MNPLPHIYFATSSGAWVTIDITPYIKPEDSGNVAGVILDWHNTYASGSYGVTFRKYGSSETQSQMLYQGHRFVWVGCDSSNRCEMYNGNATYVGVYLIGYYTTDEAVFFDTAIDKSISALLTWTDVDIGGDTGADTALAGIFRFLNTSGTTDYVAGLRKNGSTVTAAAYGTIAAGTGSSPQPCYCVCEVDANEICEHYIDNVAMDLQLVGYIKSNYIGIDFTSKTTTTTGSYVNVDTGAGAIIGATPDLNGAYFWMDASTLTTGYAWAIRRRGESTDKYPTQRSTEGILVGGIWSEINWEGYCQQKISNAALDLYLTGISKGSRSYPPRMQMRR